MKNLLRKLEAVLAATAFAEEGEAETARRIMVEAGMPAAPRRGPTLESAMAASAFAEDGDADTARRLLAGSPPPPPPAEAKTSPAEPPAASAPSRPRVA